MSGSLRARRSSSQTPRSPVSPRLRGVLLRNSHPSPVWLRKWSKGAVSTPTSSFVSGSLAATWAAGHPALLQPLPARRHLRYTAPRHRLSTQTLTGLASPTWLSGISCLFEHRTARPVAHCGQLNRPLVQSGYQDVLGVSGNVSPQSMPPAETNHQWLRPDAGGAHRHAASPMDCPQETPATDRD